MLKQLFKILIFVPIIILDGTLLALLPGANYFIFSIALLILMIYREDPIFRKFKWIAAIFLGLFSVLPWYVFAGLLILWVALARQMAAIMFAAKSVPSLIVFYLISYGLFDFLFLAAKLIQNLPFKEPFQWASLLNDLKFAGLGLMIGSAAITVVYSLGNYFEKKFKSWFFIRRHGY